MSTQSLTVGTDGACLGNPGPAGWAWVDEHGNYHSAGQAHGTNQIAELNAVLAALHDHPYVGQLIIQTDSTYARDCSTTWRADWQRNGMRNAKRKPVANAEIITAIWAALDARSGAAMYPRAGHSFGYLACLPLRVGRSTFTTPVTVVMNPVTANSRDVIPLNHPPAVVASGNAA